MIEFEEVDYAAIITVTLPGMDRPATVTLTLKPPDAVEVAPGEVKPLRDCTLSDLQAFADALEADLWEQYHALTLTQLAANAEARLKITILGEAGEPLSAAQEQWLQESAATAADGEETAAEPAPEQVAEPAAEPLAEQAAEPTAEEEEPEPPAAEAGDDDEAPPAEEKTVGDDGEAPVGEIPVGAEPVEEEAAGEAAVEEAAPAAEQEPAEDEEETPAAEEEVAGELPPVEETPGEEAPAAEAPPFPAPVETPVVEGAEPRAAPVTAPPADGEMRVAGLRRPVGHPTPAAVDILVNEPAFRDAQEHALSSLNREVAGMLVGPQPEKQPDGRYVVHVTDVIAAKHTRMSGASVTYTPESWRYVTDVLEERYPDGEAIIVGWYHTHPGFGIFLSGMDLFIHQHFFTQTWHVALVLDPRANRSGFFCWNRQQTAVQPYEFPWPRWAPGSW